MDILFRNFIKFIINLIINLLSIYYQFEYIQKNLDIIRDRNPWI